MVWRHAAPRTYSWAPNTDKCHRRIHLAHGEAVSRLLLARSFHHSECIGLRFDTSAWPLTTLHVEACAFSRKHGLISTLCAGTLNVLGDLHGKWFYSLGSCSIFDIAIHFEDMLAPLATEDAQLRPSLYNLPDGIRLNVISTTIVY